jgi:hypothetical protein
MLKKTMKHDVVIKKNQIIRIIEKPINENKSQN